MNLTKSLIMIAMTISLFQLSACKKDKPSVVEERPVTSVSETNDAETKPVVISTDDKLTTDVKDAVKDFPGVTTVVADGEIVLTGEITRDRLPLLMQSLHALHPKKITNNLTVNKQ